MSSSEQPTFSHSGHRYLLGYTSVEYGIWDRQAPGGPVQRYPKSDQGWADAWGAYQSLEAPAAEPAPSPAVTTPAPTPAETTPPPLPASPPQPAAPSPASAPTAQLPAAAAGPSFQITGALVAMVLKVTGWALLGVLPVAGIGFLIAGGPFAFKMFGLALIVLGPAFWGICTVLAKAAQD
jgi:hypothetical protein